VIDPIILGIAGIVLLLILFFLGVPIAFAMGIAGAVGFAYVVSPEAALYMVANDVFHYFNSYAFSVLTLFIFMGSMAYISGIGTKAFNVAYVLLGQLKGGLLVVTAIASAIFGAVTGSGAATAASIGQTAIPEMKKHGYNTSMSLGAVACAGTLGFMIPPSIPFIIYALLTEQSVGKLFISGIIPGIIITVLFVMTAILVCWIKPELGPAGPRTTLKQKFVSLFNLLDAIVLFVLVIGGMLLGFFTPAAAGAIGGVGAIVIGLIRREVTWRKFLQGLKDSLRLSCMMFMLIVGAMIFGHFMSATTVTNSLVIWVQSAGLSSVGIILFVSAIFFVLSCFIDITPLLVLLVPLFYPLILESGADPIWFGVVVVTLCMIGIITPPVGAVLFVTKGLVSDEEASIGTVYKGALIFLIPMLIGLAIILAFPQVSTFLPSLIKY